MIGGAIQTESEDFAFKPINEGLGFHKKGLAYDIKDTEDRDETSAEAQTLGFAEKGRAYPKRTTPPSALADKIKEAKETTTLAESLNVALDAEPASPNTSQKGYSAGGGTPPLMRKDIFRSHSEPSIAFHTQKDRNTFDYTNSPQTRTHPKASFVVQGADVVVPAPHASQTPSAKEQEHSHKRRMKAAPVAMARADVLAEPSMQASPAALTSTPPLVNVDLRSCQSVLAMSYRCLVCFRPGLFFCSAYFMDSAGGPSLCDTKFFDRFSDTVGGRIAVANSDEFFIWWCFVVSYGRPHLESGLLDVFWVPKSNVVLRFTLYWSFGE